MKPIACSQLYKMTLAYVLFVAAGYFGEAYFPPSLIVVIKTRRNY